MDVIVIEKILLATAGERLKLARMENVKLERKQCVMKYPGKGCNSHLLSLGIDNFIRQFEDALCAFLRTNLLHTYRLKLFP